MVSVIVASTRASELCVFACLGKLSVGYDTEGDALTTHFYRQMDKCLLTHSRKHRTNMEAVEQAVCFLLGAMFF